MTDLLPRRGMIAALLSGFGGGAVALAAIKDDERRDEDVATLIKLLDWHGEDAVAQAVAEMIDLSEVNRRARAIARRDGRSVARRKRRERHDDAVLFRGAVQLDSRADEVLRRGLRTGASGVTSHRIQVGALAVDLTLWTDGRDEVVSIPRGSRLLIDLRRPLGWTPCAEIVLTQAGDVRLHLWARQQPWDVPPTLRLSLAQHAGLPGSDSDDEPSESLCGVEIDDLDATEERLLRR